MTGFSPHFEISLLSVGFVPTGTDGCGIFGTANRSLFNVSSTRRSSSSIDLISFFTASISLMGAAASFPSRFCLPISSETVLRRFFSASPFWMSARRLASSSSTLSIMSTSPFFLIPSLSRSGCSRMNRMSSIGGFVLLHVCRMLLHMRVQLVLEDRQPVIHARHFYVEVGLGFERDKARFHRPCRRLLQ